MNLKHANMMFVHGSMDRFGVRGWSLPVSHIHEKLWCIDRQFVDDCIAIFGNSSCNHHHKRSFEHVVD